MSMTPVLERLGAEDERILELERGPIVGHLCKVVIVESRDDAIPLDAARLREAVLQRIGSVPRCLERIQPLPHGLGRPVWVPDSGFDVTRHVQDALPDGGSIPAAELPELVAGYMLQRLDRAHPLWTIHVARLADGRAALIWRVHHCMADGMTMLGIGGRLLWPEDEAVQQVTPAAELSHHALIALAAQERMLGTLSAARRAALAVREGEHWRAVLAELGDVPGTVRRELTPAVESSPLDAPVGTRRAVAWTSARLDRLHDTVKGVVPGATINDAVVAVVAGGVGAWLRHSQRETRSIRVRIPVSLHSGRGAAETGNRDSFIDVEVPLHGTLPERLAAVSAQTAERKRRHDAEHLDRLFREVGLLPFGSHALAMTAGPREFSLCVSNVPGPATPIRVLGGRVSAIYPVVEIAERHALRASVLSVSGTLCFALCANPDAVDPAIVMQGMEAALAELS